MLAMTLKKSSLSSSVLWIKGFVKLLLYILVVLSINGSNKVVNATGPTSKVQVNEPESLKEKGGFDHVLAKFGPRYYGDSIKEYLYYINSTMCDSSIDYSKVQSYPQRLNDDNDEAFIVMLDRSDNYNDDDNSCSFVTQVRNAQKFGAVAVIIADIFCLCSESTGSCAAFEDACESQLPPLVDDGTATDITIPSVLLLKQDADKIKDALQDDTPVRMKLSWDLGDHVDYDLWTMPIEDDGAETNSQSIFQVFGAIAQQLGKNNQVTFTPHLFLHDGIQDGCQGIDGTNECLNLCTNNGRYCAPDPDDDTESGLSGADVVTEGLRRICIWYIYGKGNKDNDDDDDGSGIEWWNYIREFMMRCNDDPKQFKNPSCIQTAMDYANVDSDKVNNCMVDSGGVDDDRVNSILQAQLFEQIDNGVHTSPYAMVNSLPVQDSGIVSTLSLFEAICNGYDPDMAPELCQTCKANYQGCIETLMEQQQQDQVVEEESELEAEHFTDSVIVSMFVTLGRWWYDAWQHEVENQEN